MRWRRAAATRARRLRLGLEFSSMGSGSGAALDAGMRFHLVPVLAILEGCGAARPPRLELEVAAVIAPERLEHNIHASLETPLESTRPPAPREDLVPTELTVPPGLPSLDVLLAAMRSLPQWDDPSADAQSRARLAGLLPSVRAEVRRGAGWDVRTQQTSTSGVATLASDEAWTVAGVVAFDFGRLAYAPEEAGLLRERRRGLERREQAALDLARAYAEWLALGAQPNPNASERARRWVLEAELEVRTGGAFGRHRRLTHDADGRAR